jgi:hypothetical protein
MPAARDSQDVCVSCRSKRLVRQDEMRPFTGKWRMRVCADCGRRRAESPPLTFWVFFATAAAAAIAGWFLVIR